MSRMRETTRWWRPAIFGLGMATVVAMDCLAQMTGPQLQDVTAEVPGHPGATYSDLLKQIVPDLRTDGASTGGHLAAPLRHIAEGYGGEPLASLDIGMLEVQTFKVGGRHRIAILTGIGSVEATVEQPTLLAVFDDSKVPKLLDAVDVGMDRDTSFGEPTLVNIDEQSQALVTRSSHFNSSENFEQTALLLLQDSRLKLVDTFSTYGTRTCGAATQQAVTFEGQPGAAGHADIVATIRESTTPTDDVCDGETPVTAPATSAETLYRWDTKALNFIPTSDTVKKFEQRTLEEINEP